MENLDQETINDLKTQLIADLIEHVLINTALTVLHRLTDYRKPHPSAICYKDDCSMRDNIPF